MRISVKNSNEIIEHKVFDEERALYGKKKLEIRKCSFDGPQDGESAIKECSDILAENCYFNLRYPFWHDKNVKITDSEMSENCRAALWYSESVEIVDTKLHGIKALRECADVTIQKCDIISPEFGWFVRGIKMSDCIAVSEYFMMRSENISFDNVNLNGKYSFQYIENAVFDNCAFDTKDAFWHAKNVKVRNSILKGEYLAWYCENVTFENCRIIGTQPFCYCKGLRLINCSMLDTDLCFEKSQVEATITTPVVSIKNPYSGHIYVPAAGEIIVDDDKAKGEVVFTRD